MGQRRREPGPRRIARSGPLRTARYDDEQPSVTHKFSGRAETQNAALEDSVDQIVEFAQREGPNSFPFVFIDPTGWTGFALDVIQPLLKLNPGEVLINFMTGHIRRLR